MITISDSAVKKIKSIIHEEDPSLKLRVFVQGGGCSGFQYGFSLEELPPNIDDLTFEKDGIGVVFKHAVNGVNVNTRCRYEHTKTVYRQH